MDASGRAMQEQLPGLYIIHEPFEPVFNAAIATWVIFQRLLSTNILLSVIDWGNKHYD